MIFKKTLFSIGFLMIFCSGIYADVVTIWNDASMEAIKKNNFVATKASRVLAMVHIAIYDAINSIDKTHEPFRVQIDAPSDSSIEAAASSAAYTVLSSLFPLQTPDFDAVLESTLSVVPNGTSKVNGIAVGNQVGLEIIAWRQFDHSNEIVPYIPGTNPGDWRPTPPMFLPAMLPNWAIVTPFIMQSNDQFRPDMPPPLDSIQYAEAFNEVKDIGAKNSTSRTAEQTMIALFWVDMPGTITTVGRWNVIAQYAASRYKNTIVENARLFAVLNATLADAGIVAWDTKYQYNLWRPVTAIREADTDSNMYTDPDPTWEPLVNTPAFSEYFSAHSTFSAAAAKILALFFGSDDFAFEIQPYSMGGMSAMSRSYKRFSDAAREAGISRIYAGIHYNFSDGYAQTAGRNLAESVWINSEFAFPVNVWYFAEGCTAGSFDEWLLIMNPTDTIANCTITFYDEQGNITVKPDILINAKTRKTINVKNDYPEMNNKSFSTKIEATNGVGVYAERAMYWNAGGIHWSGGHDSIGSTDTSKT